MRRVVLAAMMVGCVPDGGGNGGTQADGGPVSQADGEVAAPDEGVEPGGEGEARFAHAAIEPACARSDERDDIPAVRLDLRDVDRCGRVGRNDRIEIALQETDDLAFPLEAPLGFNVSPAGPARGVWVDEVGTPHEIEAGVVQLERFDLEEGASGRYLLWAGGEELEGRFEARGCEVPEEDHCYGGVEPPPPEDGCVGPYEVTRWLVDRAVFDTQLVNQVLMAGLASGELAPRLDFAVDELTWVDVAAGGADPQVPASPPVAIERLRRAAGDHITTTEPAELFTLLPASDYPGAEPLVWHLEAVEVAGDFTADCASFSARFTGAFRTEGFSIPGAPDRDLDGDGHNESMSVVGILEASRQL